MVSLLHLMFSEFAVPGALKLRRCSDLIGAVRRSNQMAYLRRHSIHDVPDVAADNHDFVSAAASCRQSRVIDRRTRLSFTDDIVTESDATLQVGSDNKLLEVTNRTGKDSTQKPKAAGPVSGRITGTRQKVKRRKVKRLVHHKKSKYRHLPLHLRPKKKLHGKGTEL